MPGRAAELIDGHLRRGIDSEMEVEVEVLDVGEEEARALLLSLDRLAALAYAGRNRSVSLRTTNGRR
jgi:hypothetical protein